MESGAADVGIVALSLALAPAARGQGRYWEVPLEAYPKMEQGGVISEGFRRRRAQFRAFLLGPRGARILRAIRLLPAGESDDGLASHLAQRAAGGFAPPLILLALGMPLAYWLAFSRRRWKFLVEAVVALPLVLPPTVLGFYVLLAIGPRSPVGALYAQLTGGMLPFSFQGLLVASVLYSLPFTVQPMAAAFGAVDRKLLEASWCLGVSRAATFRRVIVPLARAGHRHRRHPQLRPHHGRVRRGADGGRQHRRRHAHGFDLHLRPGAGARLRRAPAQTSLLLLGFSFAVLALTYALAAAVLVGMAGELICRCRKRLPSRLRAGRRRCASRSTRRR